MILPIFSFGIVGSVCAHPRIVLGFTPPSSVETSWTLQYSASTGGAASMAGAATSGW